MLKGIPFEEWSVGLKIETEGRTLTETDVVSYVNTVGYTESLFLDMEYMKELGHARRMAPALLTCSISDGLIIRAGVFGKFAVALLGIDGLRARAPVYVGDTLRVEVEVTEVRPSKSKPDRGVVGSRQTVRNQEGEIVLEYNVRRMILRSG